jgi:hypothetical protein
VKDADAAAQAPHESEPAPVVVIVFAVIFAAVGGLLLYLAHRSRGDAAAMDVATTPASEVASLAPGVRVELKGVARCETPVEARFTHRPSVFYETRVVETVEWYETGSDGRRDRRTQEIEREQNAQSVSFDLVDASGSVRVDPAGATIEAPETWRSREPPPGSGNAWIDVAAGVAGMLADRRSLHVTYTERALEVDRAVYVLGFVRADRSVGLGEDGKSSNFVVSHKSEEQRRADLASSVRWLTVGGGVLIAVGVVLLLFGRRWFGV